MKEYILKVRELQKKAGAFIQDNPDGFPGEAECENMTETLNQHLWSLDSAIRDGEQEDVALALVSIVSNAFAVVNKMGMHKIFDDMFEETLSAARINLGGVPEDVTFPNLKKYLEKDMDQLKMKFNG